MSVKAEHLHAFCVVAREGSVSAAAGALGLSQPAVSRHLARLQAEQGTPLYERSGQGVTLTPAGHALLPYACAVSRALSRARLYLKGERDDGRTRLRIGLSHHLTTRFTGPLLRAAKRLGERGQPVRLHLLEAYSSDLGRSLAAGDLDAAYVVGADTAQAEAVRTQRIGEDRLALLVLPDDPLGAEPSLSPEALEGETLVVPSSASTVYRLAREAMNEAGVRPGRILEVSGPAAVRSAILDGLGIGVTVASFVRPETAAGSLRLVALDAPGTTMPLSKWTRPARELAPEQEEALAAMAADVDAST